VLTLIGLTLLFASLASALGLPRATLALRSRRAKPSAILPVVTHLLMTVWFFAAGTWAMFVRGCVG